MLTFARLDRDGTLFKVILFSTILLTVIMVCLSYFDVWSLSVGWSFILGFVFLGLSTFFISIEKYVLFLGTIIVCFLFSVASLIILIGDYFLTHSSLCHSEPSTALCFFAGLLSLSAFVGIFEFIGFAFVYYEKWKKSKYQITIPVH